MQKELIYDFTPPEKAIDEAEKKFELPYGEYNDLSPIEKLHRELTADFLEHWPDDYAREMGIADPENFKSVFNFWHKQKCVQEDGTTIKFSLSDISAQLESSLVSVNGNLLAIGERMGEEEFKAELKKSERFTRLYELSVQAGQSWADRDLQFFDGIDQGLNNDKEKEQRAKDIRSRLFDDYKSGYVKDFNKTFPVWKNLKAEKIMSGKSNTKDIELEELRNLDHESMIEECRVALLALYKGMDMQGITEDHRKFLREKEDDYLSFLEDLKTAHAQVKFD